MVILNTNHEIRTWMILLICLVMIGLLVYVAKLTVRLRKYEKLYRSQSDINESISVLTTKLNSALEEINTNE